MIASHVNAEMTGASYKIRWDSINSGGGDDISGSLYNLHSTTSEVAPGSTGGLTYNLRAGYQQPYSGTPVMSMIVQGQAESPATTFTAFDDAGKTVTVAATAGFVVDDYILVVENEGAAQEIAVGQITNIAALVITVDKWSGDNATIGAVGNIYELNGYDTDLGRLSTSTVETTVTMVEIITDASDGYTCYITEDDDLKNVQGDDIDDLADASVTVGSEEYGIERIGDNAVGAGNDIAITTGYNNFATKASTASEDRTMAIHKAAIKATTAAGDYSQQTHYYCLGDF